MKIERINELIKKNQYMTLRNEIMELNYVDVAALLEELPTQEQIRVFRLLPKDIAADVFSYLPVDIEQLIITSLTDREVGHIIDNLYADDAVDMLDEMPANVVKKILASANAETRRDINHLLKYPEDSAGSIMTVEFVDLKESSTVKEAIERIRRIGVDKETINVCYVLDSSRKLQGTVTLRRLLLSSPDALIGDVMREKAITVNTLMDQEHVGLRFQKYDLTAMPVVDSEGRLVGIITVDDIVDIIQQEATEDIQKMAAMVPTDKPYMKAGVIETYKKRIPWLLLLMISATFTGMIINSFQDALSKYVLLTAFIPMLMDTGGNAGGQSSVTIIRALSLNEIEFKDSFKILWKEIRVALLCAITLGVANLGKLRFIDGYTDIAMIMVIVITLFFTVLLAKIIGCLLPIGAKKIGFDPAVMASPFITTIVDALSLLIYFQIAKVLLGI